MDSLQSRRGGKEFIARHISEGPIPPEAGLMESILERSNMKRAIKRVVRNKGAPGVDGMTVRKIKRYLKRHWSKIEQALLDGTYTPMPVRRKEISKPGGVRLLGIPTVLDRVIQSRRRRDPNPGADLGLYVLRK
jgi:RNA-directed DNA polymerase